MFEKIKIQDKFFEFYISHEKINREISRIAQQMNRELKDKQVIFVGILNGAFMFAADLLKLISFPCEVSFIKLASYSGKNTTGKVKKLIGFNESIQEKTVVIIEDIIDTGITAENIIRQINDYHPEEIRIASLFFKQETFTKNFKIDYFGMKIPDYFIVGYGLDYNGIGRNLSDIYKITD